MLPHILNVQKHVLRRALELARAHPPWLTCPTSAIRSLSMINVTDNAVRQLRSLLETQSESGGKGLRVQIAKGGCSGLQYEMSLDARKEGDAVVARDGVEFLVDDESAQLLRGATLDFHEGLTGTGFQIVNPNAARTCGCGTSFEPARPA
ncbi:MAG TPA: iron-sulfur cluster assembly accessory protein [Chthoniobacterales bacterium]|nr:iron-sulfur cluster assembly accessory protein [Chthoniobacterales bacterium]